MLSSLTGPAQAAPFRDPMELQNSGSPFPRRTPSCAIIWGTRSRFHSATLPSEVADYADEIRLAFLDLGRALTTESLTGECSPVIDVYENDEWVEIVVDLPGVNAAAIRATAKGDTVLIVGEKARLRPDPDCFISSGGARLRTVRAA